jgi:hypothetical protein
MRDSFSQSLYAIARRDRDVMLVSSDTGAICHDEFRKNLPGQYLNVGIAEQNMVGVAAGLAMSGKKVFVYAIVPSPPCAATSRSASTFAAWIFPSRSWAWARDSTIPRSAPRTMARRTSRSCARCRA